MSNNSTFNFNHCSRFIFTGYGCQCQDLIFGRSCTFMYLSSVYSNASVHCVVHVGGYGNFGRNAVSMIARVVVYGDYGVNFRSFRRQCTLKEVSVVETTFKSQFILLFIHRQYFRVYGSMVKITGLLICLEWCGP